jgi:hypothetical protein
MLIPAVAEIPSARAVNAPLRAMSWSNPMIVKRSDPAGPYVCATAVAALNAADTATVGQPPSSRTAASLHMHHGAH